ncbi:hypothetical protein KCV87_34690 [Actinosynnema pretiosum subsp. pretiosum]|uniref:Uncharacterized protein n=1 Tax=Actinosynnema pretiosum subsp. pretiosum TaxID=103721 RepID=A0AA45R488_9PSEU|nr:hypothetical protein APASM_4212 [Actinosynnema pretiosum subsp. pretiosum]QUF04395.1 hypothetical protein KCV87_34690 [Actinosynnema pretiosum subsp. pretiosum]
MFAELRRRNALKRVRPGHGRVLKPFRRWQTLSRSLLSLEPGDGAVWTVEVLHWKQLTTEDGRPVAHLYRNGAHHAESPVPAVFPVPGGVVEVQASAFGLKRCHHLPDGGGERQLVPDPDSGEGRRARFGREHPVASRWIGIGVVALLVVPVLLMVPQLLEAATRVPPVAERFGTFTSPVELPWWGNVALGLVTAAASTERALRLRHHWLLDSVG